MAVLTGLLCPGPNYLAQTRHLRPLNHEWIASFRSQLSILCRPSHSLQGPARAITP
jgi:hypothetical protein